MTPLLVYGGAYGLGVLLGGQVPVPVPVAASAALLACAVALGLAWHRREGAEWVLIAAAIGAGWTAYTVRVTPGRYDPCHIPSGTEVALLGCVVRDVPAGRPDASTVIEARCARVGSEAVPVRGRVVVRALRPPEVPAGRDVVVVGTLRPLAPAGEPGRFDALAYYSRRFRAFCRVTDAAIVPVSDGKVLSAGGVRRAIIGRTRELVPRGARGVCGDVMLSMVFGAASLALPDDVLDAFRSAGTVHVLVVSGAQVSLLALVALWLAGRMRLSRWAEAASMAAIVLAYAAVLPPDGTVLRAVTMLAVLHIGRLLHRGADVESALVAAVFAIAVCQPAALYDLSLQLSAAAVLGVTWGIRALGPPSVPRLRRSPLRWSLASLRAVFAASLGASVLTAPVTGGAFGQVSLVGPIANLVAVPAAALLTILMFVSVPLGYIAPPVALAMNAAASELAGLIVAASEFAGGLPWAAYRGALWPAWLVVLAYLAIVLGYSAIRRRSRRL